MQDDSSLATWRAIPGYEGLYEASDHGQVRSVPREVPDGRPGVPTRKLKGRVLKATHASGYPAVTLSRGNEPATMFVHRAVLAAFTGHWGEGLACCHYDGDKTNNSLDNLRWDTYTENNFDQIRHGTHTAAAKVDCKRGHALAGLNLVETYNVLKDGTKNYARNCRACQMARAFMANASRKSRVERGIGILPDLDLLAQAYYVSILAAEQIPAQRESINTL